jgi:hypothetical protein
MLTRIHRIHVTYLAISLSIWDTHTHTHTDFFSQGCITSELFCEKRNEVSKKENSCFEVGSSNNSTFPWQHCAALCIL